jgi:hypothetical protein
MGHRRPLSKSFETDAARRISSVPGYLKSFEWLRTLWPLLVVAGIISLVIWAGYIRATSGAPRRRRAAKVLSDTQEATGADSKTSQEIGAAGGLGKALLVIFSFSMLGLTIGWLTGDGGTQVLASVLPAVLTLIGGLAVFLVGRQMQDATMIAAALTGLTLNLLVGALLATENTLTVKEHEREQNAESFRSQVGAATGINQDSDVEKLQAKINDELQQPHRAGQ